MKKISLLGSTGSIGKNVLKIVEKFPKRFSIKALGAAGNNLDLFAKQINKFNPDMIFVANEDKKTKLSQMVSKKKEIVSGNDGIKQIASFSEANFFVSAIVGAAGLIPTIKAIESKKDIALANKETLVMAGELIMKLAKENGVKIFPIDSEHSAIFQCLENINRDKIKEIFLTGSGGPFLNKDTCEMKKITLKEALNHPNWSMGKKITIDSATLMNKGLELIEAKHLFNISEKKIKIIIHPESIVHSMVAYKDGSVMAQLGVPDMKTAISYALSYPERLDIKQKIPDFIKIASLNFYEPNLKKFPSIKLAYSVLKEGGSLPAVMNAANEVAVYAFLNKKIAFDEIFKVIKKVVANHKNKKNPSIEEIISEDRQARQNAENIIKKLA